MTDHRRLQTAPVTLIQTVDPRNSPGDLRFYIECLALYELRRGVAMGILRRWLPLAPRGR